MPKQPSKRVVKDRTRRSLPPPPPKRAPIATKGAHRPQSAAANIPATSSAKARPRRNSTTSTVDIKPNVHKQGAQKAKRPVTPLLTDVDTKPDVKPLVRAAVPAFTDDLMVVDAATGAPLPVETYLETKPARAVAGPKTDAPDPTRRSSKVVRVTNLPKNVTETDIRHAFRLFGKVDYVRVDRGAGRVAADAVALIEFAELAYAELLIHYARGRHHVWVKQRRVSIAYDARAAITRTNLESDEPTACVLFRRTVATRMCVHVDLVKRIVYDYRRYVKKENVGRLEEEQSMLRLVDYRRVLKMANDQYVVEMEDVAAATALLKWAQRDHTNNSECCVFHVAYARALPPATPLKQSQHTQTD